MTEVTRVLAPFWLFGSASQGQRRATHLPTKQTVLLDAALVTWLQGLTEHVTESELLTRLSELGVKDAPGLLQRLSTSGMLLEPHDKYQRDFAGVTLVGYGPFGLGSCPMENLQVIRDASLVITLDAQHELSFLQEEAQQVVSLEHYLAEPPREQALQKVAQIAFDHLQQPGCVFAFRGHPVVGSAPVAILRGIAEAQKVPMTIMLAASFLDAVYATLSLDPFSGMAVIRPWQINEVSPSMNCVVVGFGYGMSNQDKACQASQFCAELRKRATPVESVTLLWSNHNQQFHQKCDLDELPQQLCERPNGTASVVVDATTAQEQ